MEAQRRTSRTSFCVPMLFAKGKKRVEAKGLLDFRGRRGITSVVRLNLRPVILGVEQYSRNSIPLPFPIDVGCPSKAFLRNSLCQSTGRSGCPSAISLLPVWGFCNFSIFSGFRGFWVLYQARERSVQSQVNFAENASDMRMQSSALGQAGLQTTRFQ